MIIRYIKDRNHCTNLAPGDDIPFPSRYACPECEGKGGWASYPRNRQHHPDYWWTSCEECDGLGYAFSPNVRARKRRRINLHQTMRSAA